MDKIDTKIDLLKGAILNRLSSKNFSDLDEIQFEIECLEWWKKNKWRYDE